MGKGIQVTALALAGSIAGTADAQITVFDGATQLVTIPSVSVGASTYAPVTLRHDGNLVFSLAGATEQKPASPGVANYDLASNVLTMPAVKVGPDTFVDVKLLNTGNYVFTVQAATLLPAATEAEIKAFIASYDALYASAVPANGVAGAALSDACYRRGGRTRAWLITDFDSELANNRARDSYRVGEQRTNVQVLALRDRVNPNGSGRREVDLSYDIVYKDGSSAKDVNETLISGSSSGTPGCSTAQTGTGWRFFGNQRLVSFALHARSTRELRYDINTGAPLNNSQRYRRDIRVQVTDPMANAKYVVVSGPGPAALVNGSLVPWSWKMVSPFLMRSAPELAGKAGNFINFENDDSFRYCGIAGTGTPVASASDCLTYGAQGDSWGFGFTATPNAAADQSFAEQGWVAGGLYRLDVYNDDGWKTVNGHAGKTPIATYYETLLVLPQTFVAMVGNDTNADRFAHLSFGALGVSGVRSNGMSATPSPIAVTWTPQADMLDGSQFRLFQTWEYIEGQKTGNAAGAAWPKLRSQARAYPGSLATSLANWPVQTKPSGMAGRNYFEYLLYSVDRGQGVLQSRVTFQ